METTTPVEKLMSLALGRLVTVRAAGLAARLQARMTDTGDHLSGPRNDGPITEYVGPQFVTSDAPFRQGLNSNASIGRDAIARPPIADDALAKAEAVGQPSDAATERDCSVEMVHRA